mmetsp:Transcript_17427/g.21461  ORF Transcript_17427/g.21461 Transcript_17427/m.21461 type:complete len:248 (-) Transcript_17427:1321-2064(-)
MEKNPTSDSATMNIVEAGVGVQITTSTLQLPANTLVIINRFVLETTSFLNRFAAHAESELRGLSVKIKRLECNLEILEARLNSIPGLCDDSGDKPSVEEPAQILDLQNPPFAENENKTMPSSASVDADTDTDADTSLSTGITDWEAIGKKLGPQYKKYVNLCKMGMPLESIKLKAQAEGLDTSPLNMLDHIQGEGSADTSGEREDSNTIQAELQIYHKMVKMGVPVDNVKQKMAMEGHDPGLLQTFE